VNPWVNMARPFRTILWKELRENLKWAALAAVLLTLAQVYALYQQRDRMSDINSNVTLYAPSFLLVGMFGCILAGAALGAVQILPELSRDRWAALLHRPVPRSTIFLGKVVAGFLLYTLAAGIPFLASVLYVAWPGQFPAPFIPGMALPAASNLVFGVAFYSVALLISLMRGRWYGRRALLSLSVLPLFIFHLGTNWIFLPPLAVSAILLVAAYGTIRGNGSASHAFPVARWSFALAMYAGVATGLCLLFFALAFLPGAASHLPPGVYYRSFVLGKDGQVLLQSYSPESSLKLTYPDGTPLTDETYLGNNTGIQLRYFAVLGWNIKFDRADFDEAIAHDPRRVERHLHVASGDNGMGAEYWYYLVRERYFVGYDKLTRRRVAICDATGFQPADATPRPFPSPLDHPLRGPIGTQMYWGGNQLYLIDFGDRSFKQPFTAPVGEIYAGAELDVLRKPFYLFVALESAVQVLDLHGRPLVSIPYHYDPTIWTGLSTAATSKGEHIFLEYDPNIRRDDDLAESPHPSFVDEIDLQGKVLHSTSAVIRTSARLLPGWATRFSIVTIPPFLAALYAAADAKHFSSSGEVGTFFITEAGLTSSKSLLGIVTGISLVSAILVLWWARRVGFTKGEIVSWAISVFIFGLPGLIAFRLSAHWPTRVPCPGCSRRRPIAIEECPACHQAWPPPKTNGTEIFADSIC